MQSSVLKCFIDLVEAELSLMQDQACNKLGLDCLTYFDDMDLASIGYSYLHIFASHDSEIPACIKRQIENLNAVYPRAESCIFHGVEWGIETQTDLDEQS